MGATELRASLKRERERGLHDTHAQMTLCVSCLFMCHCAHNKCFDCFSHVDCSVISMVSTVAIVEIVDCFFFRQTR